MHKPLISVFFLTMIFGVVSCGGGGGSDGQSSGPVEGYVTFSDPWPADVSAVVTPVLLDGANDQVAMPVEQAGPAYGPVRFAPVDITAISLGVDGNYLYMRVDYDGVIPTAPFEIVENPPVERQFVKNQGMNIALNVDDDIATGGGGEGGIYGIDIFFAVGFDYGSISNVYVNWDFVGGDLHLAQGHALGELGEGGQGYDYVIVRFDISALGSFFPQGSTVDIGSWSEAESFNSDGSLKYHHFAFDEVTATTWTIP